MAIEIPANRTAVSLIIAAGIVGAAPITVMHQCNRRKNKDEGGQHGQKLNPEEEWMEVECCYFQYCLGFLPTILQVWEIVTAVVC